MKQHVEMTNVPGSEWRGFFIAFAGDDTFNGSNVISRDGMPVPLPVGSLDGYDSAITLGL